MQNAISPCVRTLIAGKQANADDIQQHHFHQEQYVPIICWVPAYRASCFAPTPILSFDHSANSFLSIPRNFFISSSLMFLSPTLALYRSYQLCDRSSEKNCLAKHNITSLHPLDQSYLASQTIAASSFPDSTCRRRPQEPQAGMPALPSLPLVFLTQVFLMARRRFRAALKRAHCN